MSNVARLFKQPQPGPPSVLFAADETLNALLPDGDSLTKSVRFGDDAWDLAGHPTWKDKAGNQTTIKFAAIADRWREAAKELALLQLNPALAPERAPKVPMANTWPAVQEPISPTTVQGNIKMLTHALNIADSHGITVFDSDDWSRLEVLLVQPNSATEKQLGVRLSAGTGRGRAQQLVALWQATQIAGRTQLLGAHPPFDGRASTELFARRSPRNTVRPHEAVGEVLGFVAWFLDNVAEDIVAHIEWWAEQTTDEPPATRDETYAAMLHLMSRLADEHGGTLPGSTNRSGATTVAAAALGRLLGVYDADEAFLAGRYAARQLRGVARYDLEHSPCPLPIAKLPTNDGQRTTWTPRLLPVADSLDIWQRRLVYYAMYYLSATVMLRDSQLATLPFDPLLTEQIERPDGTSYTKHTLSAYRTKNRRAPTPTTVVVNDRVARVVQLLHRLQQALGYTPSRHPDTGLPYLFDQRLATPLGKSARVDARDGVYLDLSFLRVIKEGASELHQRGVIAGNLDHVTLNMRQVRITTAQAYAVREHGQALAAAYGQWDTARVVAGYVGDVHRLITPIDPDETRDVALQDIGRRVARTAADQANLTGNGTERFARTVDNNMAALRNPQPMTPARLRTIGKNNTNIEQGPLSLCVFQPEGALCGGKGKSDFRLCWPGQCRNSVMTQADRARYELRRRQHLAAKSDVLRRSADKMNDANPAIAIEFASMTDDEVNAIVWDHIDDYIKAALEERI